MKSIKNLPFIIVYYGVIIPISLLPFPVLYLFSDFLYLIIYKVIGYRKKVVFNNLKNSFPEKNDDELKSIEKKFYKHFCDIVVESIKGFTISKDQIQKRLKFKNIDLVKNNLETKSVILAGGHYGNWEWIPLSLPLAVDNKVLIVYQKLKNKFFDSKIKITRSRLGATLFSKRQVAKLFEQNKISKCAIVMVFDQSPGNPRKCYWMRFLNQETATLIGTEKYSKQYDYPVIYGDIKKLKRGYYEVEFKLITDQPQITEYGEITTLCMRELEKTIRNRPEHWLWSHKRWKHQRKSANVN